MKGRAEGEAFGRGLYITLNFVLVTGMKVLTEAIKKKYPSSGTAVEVAPTAQIASLFMPNEATFVQGFGDAGAVDGAISPLCYVEPTGTCIRTEKECHDADGIPYINTDYHLDPLKEWSTPAGFDGRDTGADTNPIPTPVQDEFVPPVEGEVTTGAGTPPNAHIDPDVPSASENFMNQCIKEESQRITEQIGTTKTVNDAGNAGPITEEGKAEKAQMQLRFGICDTQYWGVGKCQKWKRDLQSTPVDPELSSQMQDLGTQTRLCGSLVAHFSSCEEGYKEIRKRYVLDGNVDMVVSSTFNPVRAKVGKLVPIRFSNLEGSGEHRSVQCFVAAR